MSAADALMESLWTLRATSAQRSFTHEYITEA